MLSGFVSVSFVHSPHTGLPTHTYHNLELMVCGLCGEDTMTTKRRPVPGESIVTPFESCEAKFLPRNKVLKSLEGNYVVEQSPLGRLWEQSGSKLKFSRWLTKSGIQDPKQVKALAEGAKRVEFKLSCRYTDILRCSDTSSFGSCLADGGCNQRAKWEYLTKTPNIAIAYVRKRNGQMAGRFFVWLQVTDAVTAHGEPILQISCNPMRPYGDIPYAGMMDVLGKRLAELYPNSRLCVSGLGESFPYPWGWPASETTGSWTPRRPYADFGTHYWAGYRFSNDD